MENISTFNTPGRTSTADTTPVRATMGIDRVKNRIAATKPVTKIVIDCTHREGFQLVARPVITQDQADVWQKQSKRGNDIDPVKFGSLVLANTVHDLVLDHETVGFNFRSEDALRLFDVGSAAAAVRAFYTVVDETGESIECDADLLADSAAVLEAAGWGADRKTDVRPL